jgi:hypothetical protein
MRLKHFTNRVCEKAGQSGTVTTLRAHCHPIDAPADQTRVRFAGRWQCRDWPVPAIGAGLLNSGTSPGQGRGSRFSSARPNRRQAPLGLAFADARDCGEQSFPKVPLLRAAEVAAFTLKPIPIIPENALKPPSASRPGGTARCTQRIAGRGPAAAFTLKAFPIIPENRICRHESRASRARDFAQSFPKVSRIAHVLTKKPAFLFHK